MANAKDRASVGSAISSAVRPGKEAEAGKSAVDAAFELLRSPEAKGREALAAEVAKDVAAGHLTVDRAKAIIQAGNRTSALAGAMEGRDINPGAGWGDGGEPNAEAEAARLWDKVIKENKSGVVAG